LVRGKAVILGMILPKLLLGLLGKERPVAVQDPKKEVTTTKKQVKFIGLI
jgi:hypothetical protein